MDTTRTRCLTLALTMTALNVLTITLALNRLLEAARHNKAISGGTDTAIAFRKPFTH